MSTIMEEEAREAAGIIETQITENEEVLLSISRKLAQKPPAFAATIARGSSDHACTYAKYLLETKWGLVTSSAAPSVATIYKQPLKLEKSLVIGLSQSGKSPDICETMEMARKEGAVTVALVNVTQSPLAEAAEFVVPLHAGEERAVAATKSYLASLACLLHMTTVFTGDRGMAEALRKLPDGLRGAQSVDWSAAADVLQYVNETLVVARGYGYPVAQEAALKLKETSSIHAEAFSGAELLHGPFALLRRCYPLLMFVQNDATLPGMLELSRSIVGLGAHCFLAVPAGIVDERTLEESAYRTLPLPESIHPTCDPLMFIQAFYIMAARLAVQMGLDPDRPELLKKVTETR